MIRCVYKTATGIIVLFYENSDELGEVGITSDLGDIDITAQVPSGTTIIDLQRDRNSYLIESGSTLVSKVENPNIAVDPSDYTISRTGSDLATITGINAGDIIEVDSKYIYSFNGDSVGFQLQTYTAGQTEIKITNPLYLPTTITIISS